jgi:site-specific recombinase XerD
LAERPDIKGEKVSFHTLRHTFAVNCLRQEGGVFHLKKAIDHSQLSTTLGYSGLVMDDLKETHAKV